MHTFWLILLGLIALFWVAHGAKVTFGTMQLPRLRDFPPPAYAAYPPISLIFAARDEAEKLAGALETLRNIDYPALEIVAVNDRSTDATAQILHDAAKLDPRLKVVTVELLPDGWLGKPHALQKAYEISTGEWLLFTDADVHFRPEALRRAMVIAKANHLEHLTLMGDLKMHGFWEKTVLTFFGFAFHMATQPRNVSNPKSPAFMGVGAFQLLKRSAYEGSGTHRRLAMEVLDDMKLGKIVKRSGYRSGVGLAGDFVTVRWHSGIGNIVRGVTKNFFATAEFKMSFVAAQLTGLFCVNILPFFALLFCHGLAFILALASCVIALGLHAATAIVMRASPLYALTQPLGAMIFGYMTLRSTIVTIRQGGIVWRDTFYPLEKLRRGLV